MDRNEAFSKDLPRCDEDEAKQLKQRKHPEYNVENGNRSNVTGSCPAGLWRSRSLSPECSGPIRCLRSSKSMPNLEGSRKEYNRMVGNSLDADNKKIDQDLVANSLKFMDDLLFLVQADCVLSPDKLKTQP